MSSCQEYSVSIGKICLQTFANHRNKRPFVSTANEALVGTFVTIGCLPFGEKIRKFRIEVKWKGNFPEIPFGNCGVPSEVLLFFRSERNGGNFLTIC